MNFLCGKVVETHLSHKVKHISAFTFFLVLETWEIFKVDERMSEMPMLWRGLTYRVHRPPRASKTGKLMPAPFLCAGSWLTIVLPEQKFNYMTKTIDHVSSCLLNQMHERLVSLPTYFRAKVAEECQWSIPTYYRKVKGKIVGDKVVSVLSNAERDKIVAVFREMMAEALNDCQRYSGRRIEADE